MRVDVVVVGAGLTGAVMAERFATQLGRRVLVVESRDHIAGNAYDYEDAHGVLVHRYGPHVFHTNAEQVWRYLSRFTEWRRYEHRVSAVIGSDRVTLPINLSGIARLFRQAGATSILNALTDEYAHGAEIPILRLRAGDNPVVRRLAAFLYEEVFLPYTLKQWGRSPEDLSASVTGRLPIRLNHDDRYFTDRYQGLPSDGYTAMVSRILNHPNIGVLVATDFHQVIDGITCQHVVYTGPVDRYFEFRHGALPYRSLRFEMRHFEVERVQPTGAMTYPRAPALTRTCEYKTLTGQRASGTTISCEFPIAHLPDVTIPFYPIPHDESAARYRLYEREASTLPHATFCGRLANYRYLNMDQAVAQALRTFQLIAPRVATSRPVRASGTQE
jgi:UDP-galactopyranose mutase